MTVATTAIQLLSALTLLGSPLHCSTAFYLKTPTSLQKLSKKSLEQSTLLNIPQYDAIASRLGVLTYRPSSSYSFFSRPRHHDYIAMFLNRRVNIVLDAASSAKDETSDSRTTFAGGKLIENHTPLVQAAVDKFISTLMSSLEEETFNSFTLWGPSATIPQWKKKRKLQNSDGDKDAITQKYHQESIRGKYKQVTGRLVLLQEKKKRKKSRVYCDCNDQVHGETVGGKKELYLQAIIKYHLATDVAQNWRIQSKGSEKSEVEIGLKGLFAVANGLDSSGKPQFVSEWGLPTVANNDEIYANLGIMSGELVTTNGVFQLRLQQDDHHTPSFSFSKSKKVRVSKDTGVINTMAHDRQKNLPLSVNSMFLQKLGLTNAECKPVQGMASKLRQCQKFVEIVSVLIEREASSRVAVESGDELWQTIATAQSNSSTIALRIIDMGCGRGYLTFSLHSYLCNTYIQTPTDKKPIPNISSVHTQGVDRRPKLIEEMNNIAQDLGEEFNSLNFVEGNIGETNNYLFDRKDFFNTNNVRSPSNHSATLDILIALHACDTATDDAIWFGIEHNADIIVTAPCCQHELRPQIDNHSSYLNSIKNNCNENHSHPLNDILRHAVYRERSTEIITDAMRAILLEIAGYETQVFEFVGGEHTSKNVMITATKKYHFGKGKYKIDKGCNKDDLRARLVTLAKMYGIRKHRLAILMGENIDEWEESIRKN